MKKISKTKKKGIELFFLSPFNFDNYDDKLIYQQLLKSLFDKTIYFLGFMEDTFLNEDDRIDLRDKIPKLIKKFGQFEIIEKVDDIRFSCIGTFAFEKETDELLIDLWEYFYSLVIFHPLMYTWKDLLNLNNILFKKDFFCKNKMLKLKIFNFCVIKGHNLDEIIISSTGEYNSVEKTLNTLILPNRV